jgi:CheY-like chemotaxis protein
MFAGTHHRLHCCLSGEEAVGKAAEFQPDLVLLDIRLPGKDGYETAAAMRKIPGLELLPIIAVTASTLSPGDDLPGQLFNGCVQKPISKRTLFDELAEFLPRNNCSPTGGPIPADDSTNSVPAPDLLLSQLRLLLIEPWPAIRDSVAVNESKVFAEGLEGLGQRWRCEPLVVYAQTLRRDAENYAVDELEEHLGEFAAVVEQLAGHARTA